MKAVVIGSGMGGLTAALLLQQRGYDVTVLEQHIRPGGMLHRFFREGAAYDTGFHYCGSVDAGQPLGQILRHLGVYDKLAFHRLDPQGFDRLRFPDLQIDVPEGWQAYQQRLQQRFPHEQQGIASVFEAMQRAVRAYSLYQLQPLTDPAALLEVEGALLVEVIRQHIRDPRLEAVLTGQAILYGVAPSQASFGVHALIMDHFLQGSFSVQGGGDKLALVLTRKLRTGGGRVLLGHDVVRVECRDRRAVAVHTESERFEADLVISNLHPRLTLELLPEEATRRAYRTRVADTAVGHAHFGAYLQLDGPVPEVGNRNLYRHLTWNGDRAYRSIRPGDLGLYFACSPTEHLHKPGNGVLLFVAPLAWQDVAPWAGTTSSNRPQAYLDYKQRLLDTAIQALEADHPTLQGRIVRAEASTPLSTEHFTRSPQGATYGHLHARDQMGRYRPSQRVRVKNMVLVGQGVFSPGVLGVALSAYYGVGQLLGLEPLLDGLRSA